jgi:hypothetical protein
MYLRGGTEAQGRPLIVLNSWNTFCNNASEGECVHQAIGIINHVI